MKSFFIPIERNTNPPKIKAFYAAPYNYTGPWNIPDFLDLHIKNKTFPRIHWIWDFGSQNAFHRKNTDSYFK